MQEPWGELKCVQHVVFNTFWLPRGCPGERKLTKNRCQIDAKTELKTIRLEHKVCKHGPDAKIFENRVSNPSQNIPWNRFAELVFSPFLWSRNVLFFDGFGHGVAIFSASKKPAEQIALKCVKRLRNSTQIALNRSSKLCFWESKVLDLLYIFSPTGMMYITVLGARLR